MYTKNMSKKYLDSKGLSYLWQKIKSEISQVLEKGQGLTVISTIPNLNELNNIAITENLKINDAYILEPDYDESIYEPQYRKGALWVFRGTEVEDVENKITIKTSAGIFEYICNLRGQKGDDGADGETGPQGEKGTGSLSYIVATCDNHVIAKYYNENISIGDLVIDNGEVNSGRRGNVYRVINIIDNPDLSTYNKDYPPSNPAIIIDNSIICNLKGDTINGKYYYDALLNAYSFGYQREIIENIKVRRLKNNEKYLLNEIYGVNWEYVNLDNKIEEGLKGSLYSTELNYIDKVSDVKYVDLSIGGTIFNCDNEIIPEEDYDIHEFTFIYTSGITGTNAFAEGDATLAEGNSAHAEGEWSTAYGDYSHAEGDSTTAQGKASHSEGENTLAIGEVSHAEGSQTLAVGDFSHAEGNNTIAQNAYEHAQGVYNVSNKETDTYGDKNTIFSIGIGRSGENRRNALEVLQNGDIYINGIGNYDGTNVLRVSDVTGKIARPLQRALPLKHVVIDDIYDWFLHAVELTKYGLCKDDVDAFLEDKLTVEFHVETFLVGMKMLFGEKITNDNLDSNFYKLFSKISGRTSFSTSNNCEIKHIPKGKDLYNACMEVVKLYESTGMLEGGLGLSEGLISYLSDENTNLNVALSGLNVTFFDIVNMCANWILSQIFLPFFDFEQPRALFTNTVKMNSLFGLKTEITSMISDNKFAVISYLDEDCLLSLASLKGLLTAVMGMSSKSNGTGTGESQIFMIYYLSSVMSQLLTSIRRQIVYNLVKDIIPNNGNGADFENPFEIFKYILMKYVEKYPDKLDQNIKNNGFVNDDGTLDYEGYLGTLEIAAYFLTSSAFSFTAINCNDTSDFLNTDAAIMQLFGLVKLYKDELLLQQESGKTGNRLGVFFSDNYRYEMFQNILTGGYAEGIDYVFNSSQLGDYNISIFHDLFGIMEGIFSREYDHHLVDVNNVQKNGMVYIPMSLI